MLPPQNVCHCRTCKQVANRPDDMPAEAWVMFLLASNVLRVAVCGALCFVAAR